MKIKKKCCARPGSVDNPEVFQKPLRDKIYSDEYSDEWNLIHKDEWNLIHKRNKFELWVDKYNHTLELTRTIVQILVFVLQLIILWKLI